jgi:hypothetical protein
VPAQYDPSVAWERPNDFRKVLSNVGSFVDLRGGYVYPERVLASERKPIRIFLCDGRNDHRGTLRGPYDEKMDWFLQNVRLMKALTQKGYDVNYTWGMNLHGLASSYPQLLVNRAPEIGGGQYLDLRKFFDLSRFRFQSRILEATPINSRLAAR